MLAGRDSECARISEVLERAGHGHSAVLLIRGEPGIGKSALLRWSQSAAPDYAVLRARGLESEADIAFSGLSELFGPVLRRADDIPAPQRVALAGALAVGPPAGADRFTICAATLSLLAAVAEDRPLLVTVDDGQWLDSASAEALAFAARRLAAEAVAMLVTVRSEEPSAFDGLDLDELVLSGLDREACRALLGDHPAGPIPAAVADRLHVATAGNPLALLEIPTLLDDRQRAGTQPLPEPLPVGPSVERAFLRRVRRLPGRTRTALLMAATAHTGKVDVVTSAGAALGLDLTALEPAEAAGLVTVADGQVTFRHPLLRAAVYASAAPPDRREAHRALASALVALRIPEAADQRAWHLAAAAVEPDEAAAAALEEAAAAAVRRGAQAAAARALHRAAHLTPEPAAGIRRRLAAAQAYRLAGPPTAALALLDEVLEASADPLVRAEAQGLRGQIETWRGAPRKAHELLTAEAERVAGADPRRAALLLAHATTPCFMVGDLHAALATARRAEQAAGPLGPPASVIASALVGGALLLRGDSDAAGPRIRAALGWLERADPLAPEYEPLHMLGHALVWLEDYAGARRVLTRVIDAARAASAPTALPYCLAVLSELDFRTGSWASAYAAAAEASRLAMELTQTNTMSFTLACLTRVEAAQGRTRDCRAHLARLDGLVDELDVTSIRTYAASAAGLLELGLGRPQAALAELEPLVGLTAEQGLGNPTVVQWRPDLVEACARAGLLNDARRALAVLEEEAAASGGAWARAAAARCRGLLAADEDCEAQLIEALHAATSSPFERARTELCLGERLRRMRRRADARLRLRSALEVFEGLGAAPWAERTRRELRACGESTRRDGNGPAQALTPQELQVALAVAGGATNREAAAALFLSPKTIEFHLGGIYRKLGIRSRTELAALLARFDGPRRGPDRAP